MGYLYLKNLLLKNMTGGGLNGSKFTFNLLIINPVISQKHG